MVKIAIAGGSGNVALEVIDALVAARKHEILLLSRQDVPAEDPRSGVSWIKTAYQDPAELTHILSGVHTVLSFIVSQSDPGSTAQKTLIDAAVKAGVRRFAPAEWTGSSFEHMDWYAGKIEIREYLKDLNKNQKVLEYSLFQPGLFTNYFTHPYPSAKHFRSFETQFDFKNCRALVRDGGDRDCITLTTVQDLAGVVALAVEYEGEWPVVGGIKGTNVSINQLLALGEKVRGMSKPIDRSVNQQGQVADISGRPFSVEKLKMEDLEAGVAECSWLPVIDHPGFTPEQAKALASKLLAGMSLGISAGALKVGDQWNQLLPNYRFTEAEEFLAQAWRDKP